MLDFRQVWGMEVPALYRGEDVSTLSKAALERASRRPNNAIYVPLVVRKASPPFPLHTHTHTQGLPVERRWSHRLFEVPCCPRPLLIIFFHAASSPTLGPWCRSRKAASWKWTVRKESP